MSVLIFRNQPIKSLFTSTIQILACLTQIWYLDTLSCREIGIYVSVYFQKSTNQIVV